MPAFFVTTLLVVLGAMLPSETFSHENVFLRKSGGSYPDPKSCSSYYVCVGVFFFHVDCQAGLNYNHQIRSCDWPRNVDCSIHKKPSRNPTLTRRVPVFDLRRQVEERTRTLEPIVPISPVASLLQIARNGTGMPSGSIEGEKCKYRVCYFTNWAQYRPMPAKQFPGDLDAFLCTHLIYAFAKLSGNQLKTFEWNDENTKWSVGNYEKAKKLKDKYPGLKVLLAVGGGNMPSASFTAMVKTKKNRAEFVSTSIKFIRRIGFDGLDMDWEYPGNTESPPGDLDRFSDLLKELREGFDQETRSWRQERLLLTAAVAVGKATIDRAYDIPKLNRYLDFINLMAYDLHGTWEHHTGHHSPLYGVTGADRFVNVDWAAKYWVSKGASKDKLVIGVPLYGRGFTLENAANNGLGTATTGAVNAGKYTREKGFIAYYEICGILKSGATSHFIQDQRVLYLVKGDQWIGYDEVSSLKEKVRYIRDNGYAGIMMWDISLDDIRGAFCEKGPYPLMHAINSQCNS